MTITERIYIDGEWRVVTTFEEDEDEEPSLTVVTDTATNVTKDSATLEGELTRLKGVDEASVWFEWGQVGYGLPNQTAQETRTTTGPFSRDITDLDPDTEYEFRAHAEADDGEITDEGDIQTFTTSETDEIVVSVETTPATSVSAEQATLNGDLTRLDNAADADVWFEWGETGAGLPNETVRQRLTETGTFDQTIDALEEDVEYEFRAHAEAPADDPEDSDQGDVLMFTAREEEIIAQERLVLHYPVREGSGSTTEELVSTTDENGTLAGDAGWDDSEPWPDSYALDNRNPTDGEDYVELGRWRDFFDAGVVNDNHAFGIAFELTNRDAFIASMETDTGRPNRLRVGTRNHHNQDNPDGFGYHLAVDGGPDNSYGIESVDDVNTGDVYHLVVNRIGDDLNDWEMYINGEEVDFTIPNAEDMDGDTIYHDVNVDVTLMSDVGLRDYRDPMDGRIGYLAIWDRELSPEEVSAEYERMPFAED